MLRSGLLALTAVALAFGAGNTPRTPSRTTVRDTSRADALGDSLIALEKRSWTAWQARDSAFFRRFLSDDHVEIGFGGPTGKSTVVAGVGSPACVVASYKYDRFRVTRFDATSAAVTYWASQSTTCGGQPVPSPVWVSSLYVLRGGRWLNAMYQQTPTSP